MLEAARKHTEGSTEAARGALQTAMRRYTMPEVELEPRVFYRITDNWLELGLRFLSPAHGARALKDAMSRDILAAFDTAGIGIASATYDIVGFPPIRIAEAPKPGRASDASSESAGNRKVSRAVARCARR